MPGPNFGNRLGSLKLTDPGGGAASARATPAESAAIMSAEVTTIARRLRPMTTGSEHIRPGDLNPPVGKLARLAGGGRRAGRGRG